MPIFRGIRSRLLGLVAAAAVPLIAMIGVGLWNQSRGQQNQALMRALTEARVLAAQVDDHFGKLENLLIGIGAAVSTNPRDAAANDTLLRRVRADMPSFISNIVVASLDGEIIGNPKGTRFNIADSAHFQSILAGNDFAVGAPLRSHTGAAWIFPAARAVKNEAGELMAILVVGTIMESFQDALRTNELPPGSIARIVSDKGIAVASYPDTTGWVGRDLSTMGLVRDHLRIGEGSEISTWGDKVERITGFATTHRAKWLVTVALPTEIATALIAFRLKLGGLLGLLTLTTASLIAWMLSGRIIRPLRRLEQDAAILAAGNLSHRTAIQSSDEVGKLSNAFNEMAAALEMRCNEAGEAADAAREAKDTLRAVIDASPVAIVGSSLDREIVLWNRAAEQIYGWNESEVVGQAVRVVPSEATDASAALHRRAIGGEVIRGFEVRRKRKNGTDIEVCLSAAPLFTSDGGVRGAVFVHEDITARKEAEELLRRLAHYDQLTGLANRRSMEEELANLLREGSGKVPTVALLDLDGFKDVNDTLGHSMGDRLLIEVARRLKEVAARWRPDSLVSRLGGDEFVIILPECDPPALADIVGAILTRLSEPYEISENVLHLGASAGLAVSPLHGTTVDELIANADLALYQAKKEGGRAFRFFTPILRSDARSRRSLDLDLRRAFREGEFELHYQPQVQLRDGALMGAEALLRWHHKERGLLSPRQFIDALTDNPVAPDVGRWIMQTACAQAAAWRASGMPFGRIGVNLFPSQLRYPSLVDDVEQALLRSGLPPEALELEITENIALNYDEAAKPLQILRARGVKIACDDFGTGYASLSCLTTFPVSRIKIDRSFVKEITSSARDAAIVRSLISMAKSLELEIIAEGVELPAQATFLENEGCEAAQGYLYGKPMPEAEFATYVSLARRWLAGGSWRGGAHPHPTKAAAH